MFAKLNMKIQLEEQEDGFNIKITGNKEEIRPHLEALKAYAEFKNKASEAGWTPHTHLHHGRIFGRLHNHFKEVSKKMDKCNN